MNILSKTKVLFFLCFSFGGLSQFAAAQEKALLWRGFEQGWTYNHRINRLGSFVSVSGDTAKVVHTSASGLGADSCFYTTHYSTVSSAHVTFQEGVVNIKLYGKEKQLITKTVEISVPAKEGIQNKEQYITLLNGFDLQSVGNADKLQLLRFSVEDAYYAPAIKEMRFKVKVAISFNCQSFECSRFNQKTSYDFNLYYLIIGADHEQLHATTRTLTQTYPWDKKIEFNPSSAQQEWVGSREYLYKEHAYGLKSLAIILDNAHWLLNYSNYVSPIEYNPSSGRAKLSSVQFFQEWVQGMKQHSAAPKYSAFSSKRKGWCVLDTEVALLQFKEAIVRHQKFSGSFYWPGKNASANVPEALREEMINIQEK